MKSFIVLMAITTCGCAGTPAFDPALTRQHANSMRDTLNELGGGISEAQGYLGVVCAWRGDEADECRGLTAGVEILKELRKAAWTAVDLYDAAGIAATAADAAVSKADEAVRAFMATAKIASQVVRDEILGMGRENASEAGDAPSSAPASSAGEPGPAPGSGSPPSPAL
jgi:hypothetical protein